MLKLTKTVSLVKHTGDKMENTISKALDLIAFKPQKNPIESVVIKANLCYYWDSSTGYTTDPQLVSGIIDCVRTRYGKDVDITVAEADATAMKTKYAFPMLGYEKLAAEKGVKLLNLSEDRLLNHEVLINGHKILFKVPETPVNADLFVNAPKLKVMTATHITCAMKNLFGAIGSPRKFSYHPFLDETIVGINKILRPHLTIVDGLIALGRFPVKMNLVMAGTDSFSVDWVASQIMGYNPRSINFLKIACKEKIGDPAEVKIVGEDLESLRQMFPHVNARISKLARYMQVKLLGLYSRVVGDVIPPFLDES